MKKQYAFIFFISCLLGASAFFYFSRESRQSTSTSDATEGYRQFCYKAATQDEVFKTFKRNAIYRQILEHVSNEQGQSYLSIIEARYPFLMNSWSRFATNDQIGDPVTYFYGDRVGHASPTTLRYVKVLGDLHAEFGSLTGKKILEIGGGYGGQCKIASDQFEVAEYAIVDLPEPLALMRKYLSALNVANTRFLSTEEILSESFDIVISNYAFSECNRNIQSVYLEKYILKSSGGYMILNNMEGFIQPKPYSVAELSTLLSNHGYEVKIAPEEPSTGAQNVLLTWKKPKEVVAKLASEVECDDFFVGSVSRKLTYPIGHRQFARNRTSEKSANSTPNGVLQLPLRFNRCVVLP